MGNAIGQWSREISTGRIMGQSEGRSKPNLDFVGANRGIEDNFGPGGLD